MLSILSTKKLYIFKMANGMIWCMYAFCNDYYNQINQYTHYQTLIMILACVWVWPVHSGTLAVKTLRVIRSEDIKSYPSKLQIFNTVSAIAVTRLRLMSLELACRGWSVGWVFGGRVQLTQRPKIHYTALKLIILPPAR